MSDINFRRIAIVLMLIIPLLWENWLSAQTNSFAKPVNAKDYQGNGNDLNISYSTLYRGRYTDTSSTYYEGVGSHPGVDITHDENKNHFTTSTPVVAIFDGIITRITPKASGWGNCLVINHNVSGIGIIFSAYAHLDSFAQDWNVGQPVRAGQPLGKVGRTGASTGIHLHFQIDKDYTDYSLHPFWPNRFPGNSDGTLEVNTSDATTEPINLVLNHTYTPMKFVQDRISEFNPVGAEAPSEEVKNIFISTYLGYSQVLGNILPNEKVKPTTSSLKWNGSEYIPVVAPDKGTDGYYQRFEKGSIQYHLDGPHSGEAFVVEGDFYNRWGQTSWFNESQPKYYAAGPLGFPIGLETNATSGCGSTGIYQRFEGGSIQKHPWGTFAVYGRIYQAWGAVGYATWDGFPKSNRYSCAGGELLAAGTSITARWLATDNVGIIAVDVFWSAVRTSVFRLF